MTEKKQSVKTLYDSISQQYASCSFTLGAENKRNLLTFNSHSQCGKKGLGIKMKYDS